MVPCTSKVRNRPISVHHPEFNCPSSARKLLAQRDFADGQGNEEGDPK